MIDIGFNFLSASTILSNQYSFLKLICLWQVVIFDKTRIESRFPDRSNQRKNVESVESSSLLIKPSNPRICGLFFGFQWLLSDTGKSFSEALILGSTNPKYDRRLFIDLRVQYMKNPSSEHGENKGRTCKQHVLNMFSSCSPHVLSLEFLCIELVNLWTIGCHIVG